MPFYRYFVPGMLSFELESLDYYERFFGTRIIRVPHPSLYRMLTNGVFQTPERFTGIQELELPCPSYEDINDLIREDEGLDPSTFVASGVRVVDSLQRRMSLNQTGAIREKTKTFWAIYDWSAQRLRDEITAANVKLPVDYLMFGCSFDGLQHHFLGPIKDRFPADYAKILEWYPLAECEIKRRQMYEQK